MIAFVAECQHKLANEWVAKPAKLAFADAMNFGQLRGHLMKAIAMLLLVGLSFSVARGGPLTLSSGLVDHYNFDGNLNDSSGNGLNLTAGGTFSYVAGYDGTPHGAVQLVTAASNGTFFLGTGPDLANQSSSVSFWVRIDANPFVGSWIFGLGHPAGTGGQTGEDMHVAVDYGPPVLYSFFNNDLDAYPTLAPGVWYNITGTYDYSSGARNLYVDGALMATDVTGVPFSGGDSLKVGLQGTSLDDLRFYDRALTATEVSELASVPDSGATLLYMRMDLAAMFLFQFLCSRHRHAGVNG